MPHHGGSGRTLKGAAPPWALGFRSPLQRIVLQLSLSGALLQKGFLHLIRKWNPNGISPHFRNNTGQRMKSYVMSDWTLQDLPLPTETPGQGTSHSACHNEQRHSCWMPFKPFAQSSEWRTGPGYWDIHELCTVSSPVATLCWNTTEWRAVPTFPKNTQTHKSLRLPKAA